MTKFEDGPAKGQTLMIKRAPVFLRLVQDAAGKWDALDQLEDTARPNETVHAYKLHGEVGVCHVNASNNRSGFYPIAKYRHIPEQPEAVILRDNEQWQVWCHLHAGSPNV